MFGQRFESAQLHLNGQPRFFEGLSVFCFAETPAGIDYQAKGFIQTGGSTIIFIKKEFFGKNRTKNCVVYRIIAFVIESFYIR